MKVLSAAQLVLLLVLFLNVTEVTCKCKEDQVEICSASSKCFCKKCISCPPGYGPSHQCGGLYPNGTVIVCISCKEGVDYSDVDSISSCQPCDMCDGKKTLRKCSVINGSVCSRTECKVGYKMNNIVQDCLPDPAFTPDTTKATTKATSSSPTTKSQITNTNHSRASKFQSTPTSPSIDGTATKRISKLPSYKTFLNATIITPTGKDKKGSLNSDNYNLKVVIILVSFLLFCVFAFFVKKLIFFLVKRVSCNKADVENDGTGIPLTDHDPSSTSNESSPRSSDEYIKNDKPAQPWPKRFLFKDIPQDLARFLAVKISQTDRVNGWRKIGQGLGVEELVLDEINIFADDGKSKGERLFEYIKSSNPKLKLSMFVSVLTRLDNNDLVEKICNEWFYSTKHILVGEENYIATFV